jgi:hypothetical protein
MMHEIRCVIHNVTYGYEELPKGVVFVDCPACAQESHAALRKHLKEVTEQRDALLRAIDIKRLQVVTTPGERDE